jgi:uncharacterized protein YfdQ (DUF2303 family)
MLDNFIEELRGLLVGIEQRKVTIGDVPVVFEHNEAGDDTTKQLEGLLKTPTRPRGTTLTGSWQSFADLLTSLDSPPSGRVYFDHNGNLRGIINDDLIAPGWKDWTVDYQPVLDESWEKWCAIDGRWLSQLDMAEFIQERVRDFVNPPGASMLELAQHFDVVRGGSFVSGVRLDSGMTRLTVEETAKGRSNIDIPAQVELAMRVFEDMDPYKFKALFRWRINDKGLLMSFKIIDRVLVLRTAVDDMVKKMRVALPMHKFYKVKTLPVPTPRLRE